MRHRCAQLRNRGDDEAFVALVALQEGEQTKRARPRLVDAEETYRRLFRVLAGNGLEACRLGQPFGAKGQLVLEAAATIDVQRNIDRLTGSAGEAVAGHAGIEVGLR